jgi:CRP-like cAMP-binding protein
MTEHPKDAEIASALRQYGVTFEAGEVLFREGEVADRALLLDDGRVRIWKRLGGAERGLKVLGKGGLLGEDALCADAKRAATAIALVSGRAIAFDVQSLPVLLAQCPLLGAGLIEQLAQRARDAEDRIQIGSLRDSQSRVVLGLLRAAQTAGSGRLSLSPLDLSARVGLDVDAVKHAVSLLREADYVRISDQQLEVPNVDALSELYGLLETGEEILGGGSN